MSNISTLEYFNILQREYVEFEIRKKIYPIIKEKNNFKNILRDKRNKINDISNRNHLKSIFNDDSVKNKFYQEIYNEYGFPNFIYSDKNGTSNYIDTDEEFYYSIGSDVKCKLEDGYIFGKIQDVNFDNEIVDVYTSNDVIKQFSFHDIARIL